jgi:predicted transcriptional regulator
MPILKPPPKAPKNETLQLRIEEEIKTKLRGYAHFINSSESYVVSEALKFLFRKDSEFKTWLEEQPRNGDQLQHGGGFPFETANKA